MASTTTAGIPSVTRRRRFACGRTLYHTFIGSPDLIEIRTVIGGSVGECHGALWAAIDGLVTLALQKGISRDDIAMILQGQRCGQGRVGRWTSCVDALGQDIGDEKHG